MQKFLWVSVFTLAILTSNANLALSANPTIIGNVTLSDSSGLYVNAPAGNYVHFRFGDTNNKFYLRHDGNHTCLFSYRGGFKFMNTIYAMDIIPRQNDQYSLGSNNFRFAELWIAGQVHCANADLAEIFRLSPSTSAEPGDVMEIDPQNNDRLRICAAPHSQLVAGVCSTEPAMILGDENYTATIEIPLALSGTVPCKVTDEGGPIFPGDLLTSSSTPGHAMKLSLENERKIGTIIGKALEKHEKGKGIIKIIISLQ